MTIARKPDEVFVFNHVMKCGGVSFSIYLSNQIKPDHTELLTFPGKMDELHRKLRRGYPPGRVYLYTHFAGELAPLFPGRTIHQLTLLREPWARFLSAYQFSQSISYFPEVSLEQFFRGSWRNPITLAIGDGDLATARRRLERDYAFFGLTEEFDKSVMMLAHLFGFERTSFVHANRTEGKRELQVPAGMKERFAELNKDDLELYAFARELFDARWRELEPSLRGRELPAAADGGDKGAVIKKLIESYRTEEQRADSFLFAPCRPDDVAARTFLGIVYRLIPVTQLFELMGQGRYDDVHRLVDNLEAFHRDCPYPNPIYPEIFGYFRALTPNRLQATVAKLLAALNLEGRRAPPRPAHPLRPGGLPRLRPGADHAQALRRAEAARRHRGRGRAAARGVGAPP